MESSSLVLGDRTFRQTYAVRAFVALVLLAPLIVFWANGEDPWQPAMNPVLFWISLGMILISGILWLAIGKTLLTISEQGIHRESIFSSEDIHWSQIIETR